ncbi:MAG: glycosyltransferase family 9 protein [Candidatus Omnitrophota bacterium]
MKKILIANIFGIGDVLNSTPLITNLKNAFPNISIDYLCNARCVDIVKTNPDIDNVFVYEKDDFIRLWAQSKVNCLKVLYKLFSQIQREKYDAVFDFTLSRKFGLFFTLAGISDRIGFDYKKRGLFLTHKVPFTGFTGRHVIEYYLDLLRCLNIPVSEKAMFLSVDEKSLSLEELYFKDKAPEGEKVVAIIPGGGASWGSQAHYRRWSPKNFAYAADELTRQNVNVIILGDALEKELCESVSDNMGTRPAGIENELPLIQYIALLSKCNLVLCNDGGPLHIAVALGVKAVFIFGPVDEKVYGPYPMSEKFKVISSETARCRPCYRNFRMPECVHEKRCLGEISPEAVIKACLDLI